MIMIVQKPQISAIYAGYYEQSGASTPYKTFDREKETSLNN